MLGWDEARRGSISCGCELGGGTSCLQSTRGGVRRDELGNSGADEEGEEGANEPAPHYGRGTAERHGGCEGDADRGRHAHDGESKRESRQVAKLAKKLLLNGKAKSRARMTQTDEASKVA